MGSLLVEGYVPYENVTLHVLLIDAVVGFVLG